VVYEELHKLYSSPDIIRQIKDRTMRGGAYGTHGRGEKIVQGFGWKAPKERDHLEDQGVDGRMGSEWILGRVAGWVRSGFNWLRIVAGGGLL
jgi:hypothetical protein